MVAHGKMGCIHGLGYRSDLIDLAEHGVGGTMGDAFAETIDIGGKGVVSNNQPIGKFFGQYPHTLKVVLLKGVLDGNDGRKFN